MSKISAQHGRLDPRLEAETLRLFVSSVTDYGIFMLDPEGRVATWNPGAERIKGYAEDEVLGRHFRMFYAPDDAAAHKPERALRAAREAGRHEDRSWRVRKDGSRFFAHVVVTPVLDPEGRLVGFGKVTRDISEQREAVLRQRVLLDELNHRVKNSLATVQSLARQILKDPEHGAQRHALESRLIALSRTHDLLVARTWGATDVGEVLQAELAPFGEAIRLSGPRFLIAPNAALALGIASFELASNAVRHGALSTANGRVEVTWSISDEVFHLTWRETGGPGVQPPSARGLGARLLLEGLPRQLSGAASLDYAPDGLVYRLDTPLAALDGG